MRAVMVAAGMMLATPGLAFGQQAQPAEISAPSRDARLAALIVDYDAYLRANDPVAAGNDGERAALSRLPDTSRAFEMAQRAPLQGFLTRARTIPPEGLSQSDRIDRDFIISLVSRRLDGIDLDTSRLAFNSEGGPGTWAVYLGSAARLRSPADAEAWISRLTALGGVYDNALENARRGLATGLTQPRSVVESAIVQAQADTALTSQTDPLLKPFDAASLPDAQRQALRERAAAAVAEHVTPRRQAWLAFLTDEALPAAPDTPGLVNRPGGREIYAYEVKRYTTTDLTPDDVHRIGLEEVARIRARMDTEMAASGWTGDFAGFLEYLRTDPKFYAASREELLEKASEMSKRADDALPGLFGTLPRLPYGVRPVPAEIEANYTTGRYSSGSMANGVAGGYLVNTSRLDQRPLYELPALTLHEAVPGHHLQISLQQEAAAQPWFRQRAGVTAFTEGWGLYAEFLGEEMNFYRTPYERFGRLSYEMWRACRLVADTGMHWMGWSVEQARACFRDNSALAPHNIETELQRYVGWPGQATAYKIGEIRLREIRTRAEAALGDRFDVRRFHDALLVPGPLPLALLDDYMDGWIAQQDGRAVD